MTKTFSSFSFGCRVNQAEKEALDRQLLLAGLTQNQQNPDVYIVNTCAVTQKAEREARQFIYQTTRKLPKAKIVVTGCAATKWIIEKKPIKEADVLIPNTVKEFAASLILKRLDGQNRLFAPNSHRAILQLDKFSRSGRFLLKIQDGCHRFCTFCIVPYLRGLPKSVPISEIIQTINIYTNKNNSPSISHEIGFLDRSCKPEYSGTPSGIDSSRFPSRIPATISNSTAQISLETEGESQNSVIKEVILTAINTEAYGYDTGELFIQLLEAIMEKTVIERVSFGSIHPWSITQDFFDFYKKSLDEGRLVKFFHIPLQSGSNKTLTLMKRGYTREEFIEKLQTLTSIDPFTYIGTDIITGFLEEDEKDFADTYEFLRDSPISKFHVFRFSRREKTAAYFMAKRLKNVSPQMKKKRAKLLGDLSQKKYQAFLQKHIGKTFPALFLEKREGEHQSVLLDNQIPAKIKTTKNRIGELTSVSITQYKNSELIGKLVS
ncbi:radical SAM protein [Candidatus Gottesmanbacteria bacterium]|nr:radical SAM protein [Candidatus Gottesmanbacteria bacterium]